MSDSEIHWDPNLFLSLYDGIKLHADYSQSLKLLRTDLLNLLLVNKDTKSTSLKDKKEVDIAGSGVYKVNDDFILLAISLSQELKINELSAANLIFFAKEYQESNKLTTTNLLDSAKIIYYKRFEAIVNIFTYVVAEGTRNDIKTLFPNLQSGSFMVEKLLKSFQLVEQELQEIQDLIKETKILQPEYAKTLEFTTVISFRRNQLFKLHQLLGKFFYLMIANSHVVFYNSLDHFKSVLEHLVKFDADDSLMLNYLPGLINHCIYLVKSEKTKNEVIKFYDYFNQELSTSSTSSIFKKPIKAVVAFFFYCFMSEWLQSPFFSIEEQKSNFEKYFNAITVSVLKTIKIGAFEQLMVICSTIFDSEADFKFYDLQSLFQKHIPNLVPKRLLDIDDQKTKQLQDLINSTTNNTSGVNMASSLTVAGSSNLPKIYLESSLELKNDKMVQDIYHQILDEVLIVFLTNFSGILIRMCDSEEDFYLTNVKKFQSNSLTIDDLTENADLGRFYVLMYLTLKKRSPGSSSSSLLDLWQNNEASANILEFLDWGLSKTTNPLIQSSFMLMLSGFSENKQIAAQLFDFINDDESLEDNKAIDYNGNKFSSSFTKNDTNSALTLMSNSDNSKISWNFILTHLKTLNVELGQKYSKFLRTVQNSYNQFLLPTASLQVSSQLKTGNSLSLQKLKDEEDFKYEDLELSEEELIELASYFQFVASISKDNEVIKYIFYKKNDFELLNILFELLDNITNIASLKVTVNGGTSRSGSGFTDGKTNELKTEGFLIGCIFNVLTSLVPKVENYETSLVKNLIWEKLDNWVFNNMLSATLNKNIRNSSPSFRTFFNHILIEFIDVLSLLNLFEALFSSNSDFYYNDDVDGELYKLPYPKYLGSSYRKAGAWPYVDYFFNDVFVHLTNDNLDLEKKNIILLKLLNITLDSFKFLNPSLPLLYNLSGIQSIDSVIQDETSRNNKFFEFLTENPATMVASYLYDKKINSVLFRCISIGNDEILDKSEDHASVKIVELSLHILKRLLNLENTLLDVIVPIAKKLKKDSNYAQVFYLPRDSIFNNDLNSFYSFLSFNLPVIGHLGLYIGSNFISISSLSIELLSLISKSTEFSRPQQGSLLINSNILLTVFETVDESLRIRAAFIDQFESEFIETASPDELLKVKVKILNFLDGCLSNSNKFNVAHFLLGFDHENNALSLGHQSDIGTIYSNKSLLKSLFEFLDIYFVSNDTNLSYPVIRLTSMVMSIIIKLCKSPLTSDVMLQLLEEINLFSKIVASFKPIPIENYSWDKMSFNGDLSNDTDSVEKFGNYGTVCEFFKLRSCFFQYLSIQFNRALTEGSINKIDYFVQLLFNDFDNKVFSDVPKILNALNVMDLNIAKLPDYEKLCKSVKFFKDFRLLQNISVDFSDSCLVSEEESLSTCFNVDDLNLVLNLTLKNLNKEQLYVSKKKESDSKAKLDYLKTIDLKNQKENKVTILSHVAVDSPKEPIKASNEDEVLSERAIVQNFVLKSHAAKYFKEYQLECLHFWTVLIDLLFSQHKMVSDSKIGLIFKVFDSINPKINFYLSQDISYAKDFVSLSMNLLKHFFNAVRSLDKQVLGLVFPRIYPLLLTCVHAIKDNKTLDSDLRADIYILINSFILHVLDHEELTKQIWNTLKLANEKLLGTVCDDIINNGDDSNRVNALVLLESLLKLNIAISNQKNHMFRKNNAVVQYLIRNNFFVIAIRSMSRTDELLSIGSSHFGVSLNSILFELTAFKAMMYLLIRVAETKSGANHLLQCGIFKTISSLKFLSIDPDIGMTLNVNEYGKAATEDSKQRDLVQLRLSVDRELNFKDAASRDKFEPKSISLFELFVPIFQLVAAILVSIGPSNKELIDSVRSILASHRTLIIGVFKRKELESLENKEKSKRDVGLDQMSDLFVLLESLTTPEVTTETTKN